MTDPITPITPAQESQYEAQAAKEGYLQKDLVGLDQFANVLTGGLPDKTISSRMARWDTQGKNVKKVVGHAMSAFLDLFQKDHGAEAESGDVERAEIVENIEATTGTLPKQGN